MTRQRMTAYGGCDRSAGVVAAIADTPAALKVSQR
jgi:hypothetical protein